MVGYNILLVVLRVEQHGGCEISIVSLTICHMSYTKVGTLEFSSLKRKNL
jgi:hypothetical protein